MGIRVVCPNGHQLNVKDFLAGKRGICPQCKARFQIPAEANSAPSASSEPMHKSPHAPLEAASQSTAASKTQQTVREPVQHPADTPPATIEPPTAMQSAAELVAWYVRPPAGGQFGPADDATMRQWMSEGRVPSDALVWRTGWTEWQQAQTVGHQLPSGPTTVINGKIDLPGSGPGDHMHDSQLEERGPMPAESAASRLQRKRKAAARTQAWMAGLLLVIAIILGVVLYVVLNRPGDTPSETAASAETE